MKKVLLIMSVLWLSVITVNAQYQRCGTMEQHELLKAQDPGYEERMNGIEQLIQKRLASDRKWRTSGVINIPVVFHILYSTNNATQNISNARIQAQMDVLTQDFSGTNPDLSNTPSVFQSMTGGMTIEFCMAAQDPNGNPTDGIVRKQTTVTSFSQNNAIKFDTQGGDDAWDTEQYLNIWVGNLGGGLLGYAQFPGGADATDGVVILNAAIGGPGAPGTATPYHLGRTATHEIGHWLNLRHITGDNTCGNDFVSDTPTQQSLNFGCPSFPQISCNNAPNGEMYMNFMDYTNDACMVMFTAGQVARMEACINTVRPGLLTSPGCIPAGSSAPVANFSASATNIPAGNSINFTDMSTNTPTSWDWTFAGGTPGTSTDQNPLNIVYNTPGVYTVTLVATNAGGSDTQTKTGYITVTQGGGGLVCDTLSNFPPTGTPSIFLSDNWGYVSGHNGYLDIAKADYFSQTVTANYQITNALIGFGVATASNTTNTFEVTVWANDGAAGSPGTELGSTTLTYATAAADAGAGSLTLATFAAPITVTGPFYLGIEFFYTAGDTLAIITTEDGEVIPNTAWEQFSTNDWHAFTEANVSWNLDMAMMILPIVCPPLGVNDMVKNNIALYPNPTRGELIIHNNNTIAGEAVVNVVNMMGQTVLSQDYRDFSGTHYLDLASLSNGLYLVEIRTDSGNMVYRIAVEK